MEFVSSIVGPIVEHAWGPIKRHLGYLIFYKRNIHNMEIKFNGELDGMRKDVQREVETAARERLEEVKIEVQTWLDNVMKVEEEVTRIKDESTLAHANNNKGCSLHFCLHHRLGRQAAAQIQAIDDLLVKKGNFNGVYTHSRAAPSTTGSLLVNEGNYVMFESRKLYINRILNAFKDETVHMIGVYGMGGIGKTTLVKEAANKAMKEYGLFKEVVMVTVSQNLDVKKIQTGIAESLGLRLHEETVDVRAGKIEERLIIEGSRVLVILDDLWEMLELSKVRIPHDRNNKGTCKVLVTTRREDVCDQMDCQKKVELRILSKEESWSLFKSRVGNVVESLTMKEVAQNVAKQCAGLPLALVVLGTALKGKKLDVWKIVLNQLKKSTMALDLPGVSNKVRESIELSYNFLESEAAKWCFLHCCLYPEDYKISEIDLMHMLVGGGLLEDVESLHEAQDRVHVLMDQLKASGLLLDGGVNWKGRYVRMHDVVRDVAIWIGERDHGFYVRAGQGLKEWPRNSTDEKKLQNIQRLSLMSNQIDGLPSDPIKCTKLETFILRGNWSLPNIPEMFFQHMGALKVLDLSDTKISCLPESIACLTSLRVLNLEGCWKLEDISPINGLKMHEILDLTDTYRVHVVPEDTGGLLNLRMVDLDKKSTPSLSSYFSNVLRGCSRLEQLFIPKYEGCLAELASLKFLTHLYIWGGAALDSNDSLSQDLGSSRIWTKLQEFQICFGPSPCTCYSNYSLSQDLGSSKTDKGSRSLHLRRTKHFSPLLKALLEMKIDSLALVHCQESEVIFSKCDIPPHVSHNLTQLLVSDCPNLTSLGDDPLFPHLKLMKVDNCPKLARLLPSKVWQGMHQLEKLEVEDCMTMLQLFPYDDHKPMAMTALLPKLAYLKLSELPELESVLQPFQCLPNLMELKIERCGLSCGLAYHEMEMAASDPFPKLEKLVISGCDEMSQMISSSSSPDAPLQGTCIVFQNLCHLDVTSCPRLTHLFWSKQAKHMQQLTFLTICDCESLTALVISNENQEEEGASASASTSTSTSTTACAVVDHHHGSQYSFFPRLKELFLYELPQLESVLPPFQCLPNLMVLEINGCGLRCGLLIAYHEMEMAAADPFPKLEELEIRDCKEMSQMISSSSSPDAPLQGMCIVFQNLRHLEVYDCPRLTHLFWSKQAKHIMQQLTYLKIVNCESLRAVVISNENQEEEGASASTSTSTSTTACAVVNHHGSQYSIFPRLTSLEIAWCESLRAVVISNENQEEEGASASASTSTSTSTSTTACAVVDHHHGSQCRFFPRLTLLVFFNLPNIVAFHQPSTASPMEWPCLEKHFIWKCPKLETPLLGPQTSERSRVLRLDEVNYIEDSEEEDYDEEDSE